MACDTIDTEFKDESEAVYCTLGVAYSEAPESAHRDPRQRDSFGVKQQIGGDDLARTPMTLPAERFDLTPINSTSDSGMFDFDEFEVRSPIVEIVDVPIDDREEDAHERFWLAELKIVQENVQRIEDDIAVEDDDDDDVPDGQFSDTEDEFSTNAPIVPWCRADKARVRNLIRRRQQPERIPSGAWLEPGEETTTIRKDASRVVPPPR